MSTHGPESNPPPAGSLQSMLARLRGMMQSLKSIESTPAKGEEVRPDLMPTWDVEKAPGHPQMVSSATVPPTPAVQESPVSAPAPVSGEDPASTSAAVLPGALTCPACGLQHPPDQTYCEGCGWIFPPEGTPAVEQCDRRIHNRFQLIKLMGERGDCRLFQAIDQPEPGATAIAVLVLRQPVAQASREVLDAASAPLEASVVEPDADPATGPTALRAAPLLLPWPSIAWFRQHIESDEPGIWPRCLDQFEEEGHEYLIMESSTGLSLWDAWDDPAATEALRFDWLIQIAEGLQGIHHRGAIVEALRPEAAVIAPNGRVRIADVTQLLPCPLPEQAPLRAGFYSAPELVLASDKVDARADHYAFGAMLYALHLGRELTESDFELHGVPKPILQRFADCHPLFGRLVSKTFCRDVNLRFPTAEAADADPTGFGELLHLLHVCQASLDRVRLEVAAWSSTGMLRAGNEDAFAMLQASHSFENNIEDHVLVLAADGMGGSDAGEVAARMTIQSLLKKVACQKPWSFLTGAASGEVDVGDAGEFLDSTTMRLSLIALISEVNKEIHTAAKRNDGRPGDGLHARVRLSGRKRLWVVNVAQPPITLGNSSHRTRQVRGWRPRHARRKRLRSARQSELQQAIGGQASAIAGVRAGCPRRRAAGHSDGVTGHLLRNPSGHLAARIAEACARQIINWAILPLNRQQHGWSCSTMVTSG